MGYLYFKFDYLLNDTKFFHLSFKPIQNHAFNTHDLDKRNEVIDLNDLHWLLQQEKDLRNKIR